MEPFLEPVFLVFLSYDLTTSPAASYLGTWAKNLVLSFVDLTNGTLLGDD